MTPTPGGRDAEIIGAVDDAMHRAIQVATTAKDRAPVWKIAEPVIMAFDGESLLDAIQGAIEEWTP